MISKILTPPIHGLFAMMVVFLALRLIAEPGPALSTCAVIAFTLGFISGIVRVRRGPPEPRRS